MAAVMAATTSPLIPCSATGAGAALASAAVGDSPITGSSFAPFFSACLSAFFAAFLAALFFAVPSSLERFNWRITNGDITGRLGRYS